MTAYHDEDENLSVAKDPRDGPLTAVDRLRLYATDPDTFYFDAEAAEEVVALLDDLDRKTVGEVVVKPLEWRVPSGDSPKDPDAEENALCADGLGGVYAISKKQKVGPERLLWWAHDPFDWTGFNSIDEAKAAAQADYEARIRSALAPSPAIGREREAEAELAKIAEHLGCKDDPYSAWETLEVVLAALRFYASPNTYAELSEAEANRLGVPSASMVHRPGLFKVSASAEGRCVPAILVDWGKRAKAALGWDGWEFRETISAKESQP